MAQGSGLSLRVRGGQLHGGRVQAGGVQAGGVQAGGVQAGGVQAGKRPHIPRPAMSGMVEVLILIGISVVAAGALAVWFGAFDSGSSWGAGGAHCIMFVEWRSDVGGGGEDYAAVTIRNAGSHTITGYTAYVGDSFTFTGGTIAPGGEVERAGTAVPPPGGGSSGTGAPGYAAASARLADGSAISCTVSGAGSGLSADVMLLGSIVAR